MFPNGLKIKTSSTKDPLKNVEVFSVPLTLPAPQRGEGTAKVGSEPFRSDKSGRAG